MQKFYAMFTRYDSQKVELRVSAPEPVNADTFDEAFDRCQDILRGLREGDPERTFELHSLSGGALSRVIVCNGARMFETIEELTQRVVEEGRSPRQDTPCAPPEA